MKWNTNVEINKTGWFLVTVLKNNNSTYVMPMKRIEYPEGNFYWENNNFDGKIIAVMNFPKPYMI